MLLASQCLTKMKIKTGCALYFQLARFGVFFVAAAVLFVCLGKHVFLSREYLQRVVSRSWLDLDSILQAAL